MKGKAHGTNMTINMKSRNNITDTTSPIRILLAFIVNAPFLVDYIYCIKALTGNQC